jgi:hypothetical protein
LSFGEGGRRKSLDMLVPKESRGLDVHAEEGEGGYLMASTPGLRHIVVLMLENRSL